MTTEKHVFKAIKVFWPATPHTAAAAGQNGRQMALLRQIFEMRAGADAGALLATPDLSYVVDLLRRSGESLSVDVLEQIYADEGWLTDRSFTWLQLQALQDRIQSTAVPRSR